jgi:hypothetical protein
VGYVGGVGCVGWVGAVGWVWVGCACVGDKWGGKGMRRGEGEKRRRGLAND